MDQGTGNRSCSVISNMLFCTHIVFVIIFSNSKLIIFEDQGKYWHILLLFLFDSLHDLANDVVFCCFYILCKMEISMHDCKVVVA